MHLDFHAHNDYDLANANILEAIRAGADGLHLTVNGMGERAGNASIASAIAVLNDFMPEVENNINEEAIFTVSKLVETFSGIRIPTNRPITGENVFTQTASTGPAGYLSSFIRFIVQSNGSPGNVVTIFTVWDEVPDGLTVGSGSATTLTVVPPETTNIANTWGTITLTGTVP
jgi:hypothetical protein